MTSPTWLIEWTPDSEKQFYKLDRPVQKRILTYLNKPGLMNDPKCCGKRLTGNLSRYWSYRIGDYRVIAEIKDNELIVLVVQLDHRRQVYDF